MIAGGQSQVFEGQTHVGELLVHRCHMLNDVHRASRAHDHMLVVLIALQPHVHQGESDTGCHRQNDGHHGDYLKCLHCDPSRPLWPLRPPVAPKA